MSLLRVRSRLRGKFTSIPILRPKAGPKGREYLRVRKSPVLHKAMIRGRVAQSRMMDRLTTLLLEGKISKENYDAYRRGIEKKGGRLQELAQKQLIRIEERDPLLQMLFKRERFVRDAGKWLHEKKSFTFGMLDIDFFKSINDRFGHAAGDTALIFFANQMNRVARKMGGFAGRWGGEEFVVAVPGGLREAARFVRALSRRLRVMFGRDTIRSVLEGQLFTFSAGFSSSTEGAAIDSLTRAADDRLKLSKDSGRNTATFFPAHPNSPVYAQFGISPDRSWLKGKRPRH